LMLKAAHLMSSIYALRFSVPRGDRNRAALDGVAEGLDRSACRSLVHAWPKDRRSDDLQCLDRDRGPTARTGGPPHSAEPGEATPSCQSVRPDGASGPVDIDWRVSSAERLVHAAHHYRPAGGKCPRDHMLRHFPRTQERRRRSHSVEIAVDFLRRIRWCGHQMAALPCSIQVATAPEKKTVPKP